MIKAVTFLPNEKWKKCFWSLRSPSHPCSFPSLHLFPSVYCIIEGRNPNQVSILSLLMFSIMKSRMGSLTSHGVRFSHVPLVRFLSHSLPNILPLQEPTLPRPHHDQPYLLLPGNWNEAIRKQFFPLPTLQPISFISICLNIYLSVYLSIYLSY